MSAAVLRKGAHTLWSSGASLRLSPCSPASCPLRWGIQSRLQALSLGCMGSAHLPSIPLLPGPRYGKLIFWDMSPE